MLLHVLQTLPYTNIIISPKILIHRPLLKRGRKLTYKISHFNLLSHQIHLSRSSDLVYNKELVVFGEYGTQIILEIIHSVFPPALSTLCSVISQYPELDKFLLGHPNKNGLSLSSILIPSLPLHHLQLRCPQDLLTELLIKHKFICFSWNIALNVSLPSPFFLITNFILLFMVKSLFGKHFNKTLSQNSSRSK